VRGFIPSALYVDDDGAPRGARFVHARTRFVFDYLRVESAPQAFLYVTTYLASDGGEAHTQEHLLLGRGNQGRRLGNIEHAMLARSSAFTAQYRTAYHFYTVSGVDTFWPLLRANLGALLHPDYSDEEVRREVRDFGVTKAPGGALALTEKGTVYNEMVNRFDQADERAWFELARMIYGAEHPLAHVGGGTPEGIRELTPEKIHRFHEAHYRLGNMGMVAAFPSSAPLGAVLDGMRETLDAFAAPSDAGARFMTEADVPPPRGAPPGSLRVVDYPLTSTDHPGPMRFAWPARRRLDPGELVAMEAFLDAFGSGPGSTLYAALVDRKTRELDVGATRVWCGPSTDPGQPVYLGLEDVAASHGDEASLRAVRDVVLAKLAAIASLPDGSPELEAFQERYRARLVDARRGVDKFLDTPPEFGERSTGDRWIMHLERWVLVAPGFRKRLSTKDALDHAFTLAGAAKNPWRERIRAWGLLDTPYAVAARPSPALRKRFDDDLRARLDGELARLKRVYSASDDGEALRRRAADVARGDEEIARAEATVPMAPFIANPPLTQDDGLVWKETVIGGVPVVASTFEGMKSATIGLALRIESVPEEMLPYLALLPRLMRDVGVLRDGEPIPYQEVEDRLRREVLGVDAGFDVRFPKERAELVLEASGNDVDETRRALGWVRDFLLHPDWRPENLPRVRDVVTEQMKRQHDTMTGVEEQWLTTAAAAVWRQDEPVLAHTGSFLTRAHDAFRLSWMLDGGADVRGFVPFLRSLAAAGAKGDRASLGRLAAVLAGADAKAAPLPGGLAGYVAAARALPPAARPHVEKAGHDLGELLADVPDASLARDWAELCGQMADGAASPPAGALTSIAKTLAAVRHANVARVWMVGSSRHQAAIHSDLERLLGALDPAPAPHVELAPGGRVAARARARGAAAADAPFVALINPNKTNASLVHAARGVTYDDPTDAALVDYLAANVFNGTGGHALFKRIWGAGLAYSGYAWTSPHAGRVELYSDRCADVAGLLRFVDGEVRRAPADPRFVDYAVTTAFWSRVAGTYESRARDMADDRISGSTPEQVRAFRRRLLALRSRPDLGEVLHARLAPVFASLVPSLAPGTAPPPGTTFFVVGAEAQVAAYERELRSALGEGTTVLRAYPRDFW